MLTNLYCTEALSIRMAQNFFGKELQVFFEQFELLKIFQNTYSKFLCDGSICSSKWNRMDNLSKTKTQGFTTGFENQKILFQIFIVFRQKWLDFEIIYSKEFLRFFHEAEICFAQHIEVLSHIILYTQQAQKCLIFM